MKKTDFEEYARLSKMIEETGEAIFDYIYKNCQRLLSYGSYAEFASCDANSMSYLYIKYCDKYDYDYDSISVPLKEVYGGTWKEYFDKQTKDMEEEQEKLRAIEEDLNRAKEIKLFNELKKKYEG